MDAAEVAGVRPTDPNLVARAGAALDALSARNTQTRRALRLLADSAKPITIGYLAETPIWRATYRLVLDADGGRGFCRVGRSCTTTRTSPGSA